jgi:hypothetical protein
VGVFFCVRSVKQGYWKKSSEEIKYRMFEENDGTRKE